MNAHSDKQGAAGNYKRGFGFHPIVWSLDQTSEPLGSSAAGIANGADGTWTVAPALVPQTVYWHARAEDNSSALSGWGASRTLTIAETITIGVDNATLALGNALPGGDTTGTSIIDAHSNDPQGYTLSATDESDLWRADGYLGVTVRDTTGQSDNRDAKWGTANASGWPATDFTNNRYAGLSNAASIVLHDTTAAAPNDTIAFSTRVTPQHDHAARQLRRHHHPHRNRKALTRAGTSTTPATLTAIANP